VLHISHAVLALLSRSLQACKRVLTQDFRGAHQKILDAIRQRSMTLGHKSVPLPSLDIDVTTLFPPRDKPASGQQDTASVAATKATERKKQKQQSNDEVSITAEVGIITGPKNFIKLSEAEQGLFFSAECYFIIESIKASEGTYRD